MKVSISIFSFIILLFTSCSTSLPEIFTQDVNHVIIEFYDAEQSTFEVLNTKDITLIQQAIQAISTDNAPAYKCGYSGKIKFYSPDDNLEIEFNLSEDCNHAVFMDNNELVSKKLSKEGRTFLLGFMEKGN